MKRIFVRICDIRNTLNWPRGVFDNMLKYLRDKRIITLHAMELGVGKKQAGLNKEEIKDNFIDENGFQMGTVTWNVGEDEAKINELDNELNKLIYGETPININSDESFESEESSEEISENEVVEAEDNKSLYTRHPAIVNSSGSDVNLTIAAPSKSGEHTTKGEYLSEEQSFEEILPLNNENVNARTSWPKNSSSVDTQSLFEFFNTANESSGFHELAHHVLRVLTDAVQLENSSDLLIEDVNKILKNAGVKYDDLVNNIGNSRETAHEYFSKSFEAYLFEGKAPVQELQSTFDRIKQWLVEIYHDIQKISGIELNDEMRDIFDRLLASPEQAAEQKNISEINSLYEAGENELQKLQEQINQLEEQLRISNEQWEEIADQAFIKGKNKGENYGIKEGRNYQKGIDKEKNNLRIEKLKQNFKLIQERQKERRNIREKYKKLVKEINRMSEAKNIHWNRLQQIKNLLSTYDNLNQKNYSLKEMQDIHSQVQELFNVGKRELAAKKLADKERIEAAKQALMKNMITEWNNRPKGAIRNRDDNAKQYNGVRGDALIDIYNKGMQHEKNYTPMKRLEYTSKSEGMINPDAAETLLNSQSGTGFQSVQRGFSQSRVNFAPNNQPGIELGIQFSLSPFFH